MEFAMKRPLNEAEILKSNPKIDPKLVHRFGELEKQLKSLGVEVKPRYELLPPLGDGLQISLHNAGRAAEKKATDL
jgi:hypothetical protein